MTIDEFVCDGIDKLMAGAAAHATEHTDASGALTIAFLDAQNALRQAWRDWLAEKVREEGGMTKYGHLTVNQRCRAERQDYRDFIERLARTELVIWHGEYHRLVCPRCDAPVQTRGRGFTHEGDCIVVEARLFLGLPVDERGNLVEEGR